MLSAYISVKQRKISLFFGRKETYFFSLPTVSPELLELREESQWDVQRLQHSSLLRLLLPTQRLGEAPPRLRPGASGAAGGRRRWWRRRRPPGHPLFLVLLQLLGVFRRATHSLGEHPFGTPVSGGAERHHGRGWGRQCQRLCQPKGEQFQQCLSLHDPSHPCATGRHLTLMSDPGLPCILMWLCRLLYIKPNWRSFIAHCSQSSSSSSMSIFFVRSSSAVFSSPPEIDFLFFFFFFGARYLRPLPLNILL